MLVGALCFLAAGVACSKALTPVASLSPSGEATTTGPSPSASLSSEPPSHPTLELAVLDAVGGHLTYCDPDVFPVGHGTPLENAQARFPTIRADKVAFEAILQHEHLSAFQRFTPDELIAISDDYKQIRAIQLAREGDAYTFSVLIPEPGSEGGTLRVSGIVSRFGSITIESRDVAQPPDCPICLAAGVRIATPNGEVRVEDLQLGMPVWTTDVSGRRAAAVVLETGHTEAPLGHEVDRLTLGDRRTVVASPGHPTADGRTVGDLRPGDRYDGSVVASTTLIPYAGETWDLLPSGPTGYVLRERRPAGEYPFARSGAYPAQGHHQGLKIQSVAGSHRTRPRARDAESDVLDEATRLRRWTPGCPAP